MRPSRRQMQPFVRRWQAGRTSATMLVVALCAGAFGAQFITEALLNGQPTHDILRQWLALDDGAVRNGQWWKFLSFGLLQAGPLQMAASLLLLFLAGRELEPIIGARHFSIIYVVGNVLGGVSQWTAMRWQPLAGPPLMAITAGIAAVIVAYTTILPELEVSFLLLFLIPVKLRAKHLAWALLGVSSICWITDTATEIGPVGMIAGAVFGWAYVKQLGYGNPLAIQRYIFDRRQRAARLARMTPEQFVIAEVDPILEKIARQGMKSLTRAERKILEQGCGKLSEKPAQKHVV